MTGPHQDRPARWAVIALVALVVVLALGACQRTPAPPSDPAPVVTESPAPTVDPTVAAYLRDVREAMAEHGPGGQTDADLIASGRAICADLDTGATAQTFAEQIAEYDLDAEVYTAAISAAVDAFCAEYAAELG